MAQCDDGLNYMAKTMSDLTRPGLKDMYVELYINGLLTGPKTFIINPASSALKNLWMAGERTTAGLTNAIRGKLGFEVPEGSVTLAEAGQKWKGLVTESVDAARMMKETLKTGKPAYEGTKLEGMSTRAITAENLKHTKLGFLIRGERSAKLADFFGAVVNTPGKLLLAQDEFSGGLAFASEVKSVALRKSYERANSLGLKGAAWDTEQQRLYNAIIQDVDKFPDIKKAALAARREATFTQSLEQGSLTKAVQTFAGKHALARVMVPFMKVPTNIMSDVVQLTPGFQFASKRLRAALSSEDVAVRQLAQAKLVMSNTIAIGLMGAASNGYISGTGPLDDKLRMERMKSGWRPDSFNFFHEDGKVTHVSLDRLQPFSTFISNAANFAEYSGYLSEGDLAEYATSLTLAIVENLVDAPFLQGFADFGEIIQSINAGDIDQFTRVMQERVISAVPGVGVTITRDVRKLFDPNKRIVDSDDPMEEVLARIINRIPGWSGQLPKTYAMNGDEEVYDHGWAPGDFPNWVQSTVDALVPWRVTQTDKKWGFISQELVNNELTFSRPRLQEFGFPMTPFELSDFGKFMSQGGDNVGLPPLGDALIEVMTDSSWSQRPTGQGAGKLSKQDAISAVRRLRKNQILSYMLSVPGQYPGFDDRYADWVQRGEGEMKEPSTSKQSGPRIESPF